MKAVIAVLAILYPVLAYLGLTYGSPSAVAAGLAVILLLRLKFGPSMPIGSAYIKLFVVTIFIVMGYSLVTNSEYGIRYYPVAISLAFLFIFSISLFAKQTAIERIARITTPNLPPRQIAYTRKVTILWCSFFFINGCIAFYTAQFSDIETWTLYNGFISYCLMGLLGGGELLIRKRCNFEQP